MRMTPRRGCSRDGRAARFSASPRSPARRQLRADRPRLRLAEHGVALDLLHVLRDPLDDRMARTPELVRRHVTRLVHVYLLRVECRGQGLAERQRWRHHDHYCRDVSPGSKPGSGPRFRRPVRPHISWNSPYAPSRPVECDSNPLDVQFALRMTAIFAPIRTIEDRLAALSARNGILADDPDAPILSAATPRNVAPSLMPGPAAV